MGKVTIRDLNDLETKIHILREAEEWNEVIRYSPCGNYLAVGSHDNAIYVYDVQNSYQLYYKCAKHNSFVTSLDWSSDSTYIRSVCGAYEKLYFNIKNKSFDSNGLISTKDYIWAT
jgi:WD40 repeat protein